MANIDFIYISSSFFVFFYYYYIFVHWPSRSITFQMHTCKTGLNKGYEMQSICICNCSYLNFKILIILVSQDGRYEMRQPVVVDMVQQAGTTE